MSNKNNKKPETLGAVHTHTHTQGIYRKRIMPTELLDSLERERVTV